MALKHTALTVLAVLALTSAFSTASVSTSYLSDLDDSTWLAGPGVVNFEVNEILGNLGGLGDLAFGIYNPIGLVMREIFSPGFMVGDTESLNDIGTEPFGFYLQNVGSESGGPYTLYSDSTLNPQTVGAAAPGEDAMEAYGLGMDTWSITFSELNLPIVRGDHDLRVTVSNIMPENVSVPEAPTLAILTLGLVGMLVARRRRRGTVAGRKK